MRDDAMAPVPILIVERPGDLSVALIPGKGRGVIARRRFNLGDVVETAPVIVVERAIMRASILDFYTYNWNEENAIVLGYGMIYNHSYTPNARYIRRLSEHLVDFVAIRDIEAGQEVLINYNDEPADQTPIAFANERWWRQGER
jgi:hypothetical protein